MNDEDDEISAEEEGAESDNTIVEKIGSDIPDHIKRNFFKVLGQLCTSAVEIPAAYLEGVAAEKRAETSARIKLIEKSANEIAEQMDFDPEYAREAVKKFGKRVIREQINLDKITSEAVKQVAEGQEELEKASASPDNVQEKDINDDWLNIFEKEASQKSTEEMQELSLIHI